MRHDGRQPDELRPIRIQRQFTKVAPGSVLISAGDTTLLVTASIDETLPPWKAADPAAQKAGLLPKYCMLPGSTSPRKRREREKVDGRSTEIQRSLAAVCGPASILKLGPRTIMIDVEVLQADGGTRTLGITGGYIALCDAIATLGDKVSKDRPVLTTSIAAVSVGISHGTPILDLDYIEDSQAEVDLNVVMTGSGEFIEIQGTAEGRSFTRAQLDQQLSQAEKGIRQLMELQQAALKG